ncbi:MAG: DUF2092 domain-containing protein [Mesorhizobium sp.]|nr:MAG: DUF2092 domain-containing protein [Mesorhizobium sp.]TIV24787.1 MAG: DUF2092 domain-containing protein [Mesorhizobium sp.]TIV68064.1 MAG: DUF2092 domain-containing protein [Mesorhizobium sp.]TIW05502.1 MAG: DUF2092 domain-containing protein [Mesorhizobium sp.]
MPRSVVSPASAMKLGMLAFAVAALLASPDAHADEAQAKALVKAMSDYMAAQKSISFQYDTSLEVVTPDDQKLAIVSSGTATIARPDRIRATRTGGFADVELVFDGKTLTLLGKNAKLYGQAEVPGTVDHLVDELREKFHVPVPGADLLMSDVYGVLMADVTDSKDLGSGVIRGKECDHLAFRTEEADWQIWIAQGNEPFPCRYEITSRKVRGYPEYVLDVHDWKASTDASMADFSFTPPQGAKQVKPGELTDIDELPNIYQSK